MRHRCAVNLFSGALAGQREALIPPYAHLLERTAAFTPVGEVRRGDEHVGHVLLVVGFPQDDEPIGICEGQRFQDDCVHDTEDRRRGAYSQRQRQHGDGRKAGTLNERAHAVPDVLKEHTHATPMRQSCRRVCLFPPIDPLRAGVTDDVASCPKPELGTRPAGSSRTILEDVEHVCAEAFAELRRVEPQQHRIDPDCQLHGKSSLAARQLSSGLGGQCPQARRLSQGHPVAERGDAVIPAPLVVEIGCRAPF